ncbi:MAG: magnesium chelatase family protein [Campylobacterota bacterium]|nr:magnesium chelatase family protein [Campylobacterota bacterium]
MEKKEQREQKILNSINSATFDYSETKEVSAEVSFTKGLPSFSIVGLASESIKESKERVKSALLNTGFVFPPLRITINLSPSDLKKEGSHFDLPIALLISLQKENSFLDEEFKKNLFVFGELGLDGKVKDTTLIFPIVLSLAKKRENIVVLTSKESAQKLSNIPFITVYGIDTLEEAVKFFKNEEPLQKIEPKKINSNSLFLDKEYFFDNTFELDFSDVKGQKVAKRAALISAAGMHNILFTGSPGCGKSMIVKRLKEILPPVSIDEVLKKSMLDANDGKEPSFSVKRAFRQPHHSSTRASIFGGGSKSAKIGEVALANHGVLFFDELPHFSKTILEALREPLEDNRLLISRVNSKIEYEAQFLFAGAMNPCPCGNLLSKTKECRCTELEVQRYKNRLSDPFLDRIDLFVAMDESGMDNAHMVSSKEMFEMVLNAFRMQKNREQKNLNGKLNEKEIAQFCKLNIETNDILQKAVERFGLSMRSINKVLKVSRTIADLESSSEIQKPHILEAFAFRYRV